VQDEVTYHVEEAIQLMEQVKWIKKSISRPGLSDVTIEFKDKYRGENFPGIYDELRRKIADMLHKLPPGAQPPVVVDSFADVGIYLALSGEGYRRDLWDTADYLKKELVLVPGVRKIVSDGEQQEVAYLEISRARLGELGNLVGGHPRRAPVQKHRRRCRQRGRRERIPAHLAHRGIGLGTVHRRRARELGGQATVVRLGDIAAIHRAYVDVPTKYYYNNGKPALTIGISMQAGKNVVEVGERLDRRLVELTANTPVGMQLEAIYDQPTEVDNSVNGFVVSVAQAVLIVLVVVLFMCLLVGMIIGAVLLITVAGTLFIMAIYGIELQHISLGALIIALGMLVDNAIVVAEGMLIRINAGMEPGRAASETRRQDHLGPPGGYRHRDPGLFAGIGFSQDATGEFANSPFYVILISLTLSWITGISTTPYRAPCCSSPARPPARRWMPTPPPLSASTAAWRARPCASVG